MTKAILQSLKVEELKTIIRSYNLHTKIKMTKRTKADLVDDLDKHVYFDNGYIKLKSGNITSINKVDKTIKDKQDKKDKEEKDKEEEKKKKEEEENKKKEEEKKVLKGKYDDMINIEYVANYLEELMININEYTFDRVKGVSKEEDRKIVKNFIRLYNIFYYIYKERIDYEKDNYIQKVDDIFYKQKLKGFQWFLRGGGDGGWNGVLDFIETPKQKQETNIKRKERYITKAIADIKKYPQLLKKNLKDKQKNVPFYEFTNENYFKEQDKKK